MFEIREFCSMIDPDRDNIFLKCQQEDKISQKAKKVEDLNEIELSIYQSEVRLAFLNYRKNWKEIL